MHGNTCGGVQRNEQLGMERGWACSDHVTAAWSAPRDDLLRSLDGCAWAAGLPGTRAGRLTGWGRSCWARCDSPAAAAAVALALLEALGAGAWSSSTALRFWGGSWPCAGH